MKVGRLSRWSWLAMAVSVAAAIGLSGCQAPPPAVVRIYASFPMRGPKIGGSIVKGIQLAFDQIESRIGSTEIKLVILDDGDENGQWQADVERNNVDLAVSDGTALAYLGPMNSGAAQVSLPISNQAGLAQISPSTTWPGLTKSGFAQGQPGIFYPTGRRTFFRTCGTDDVQGPAAAQWAGELGFHTFYVLDDGEAYGAGIAALFSQRAVQLGLTELGRQTIDKKSTDFRTVLAAVKRARPDVVYFGGTVANGAALLVQQMRALGIEAAFMGPDAILDTTLIDIAGPAAEGVYATFVGVPPDQTETDLGRKFVAAYREKYNEPPEAYAQLGFDAAQTLIAALQQAPTLDRAGVLTALSTPREYQGTTGAFAFDAHGDTTLQLVSGNIVRDGAFQFAKRLAVSQ
jgi:branched-chain amino acid transport system substrate-binding protein